ncbi:hypothetical protein AOLI_G00123430 [Acnodon oligacanthus]
MLSAGMVSKWTGTLTVNLITQHVSVVDLLSSPVTVTPPLRLWSRAPTLPVQPPSTTERPEQEAEFTPSLGMLARRSLKAQRQPAAWEGRVGRGDAHLNIKAGCGANYEPHAREIKQRVSEAEVSAAPESSR